ncbi:hypothetical protein [Dysgonomonas sp. ZJ279]|uniref:hypothetical protein n=1 Tax=Dysgonomonas sp. ZJ279 TaxID=2709796 RepID=UPI0013EA7E2F|nr:hypothetical protein [Dysgonomonas sp. ZJ279]
MKNENNWHLLLNPFVRIAGWKAFLLGSLIASITIIIGYFSNVWYPGVLDIKLATHLNLGKAFLVQIVSQFYVVFFMYPAALIFAKNTRLQDILGTTMLARFPFLIASLLGFMVKPESIENLMDVLQMGMFNVADNIGLIAASIIMVPIIIWYVILLYNAFKVSSNIKGTKAVVTFTVCLILAEIVSLIVNWVFIKYVYETIF